MKTCLSCGLETEGSIGKSGVKWNCICQPCKDKEDEAMEKNLKFQTKVINNILNVR